MRAGIGVGMGCGAVIALLCFGIIVNIFIGLWVHGNVEDITSS